MIFIEKYRCKTIDEFVGNDNAKKATKQYMDNYPNNKPALLYTGPPGTGKTTLAILLALSMDIPYHHINSSELRKPDVLRIGNGMCMASITGTKKLIIFDECDNLDKRTQKTIAEQIQRSKHPVIVIANFPDKIGKPLKQLCKQVKFKKPTELEIMVRLKQLKLDVPDEVLESIVEVSDTIRSALNSLDAYVTSEDITEGETIHSLTNWDIMRESVEHGHRTRQKFTPEEIVTYLHDSGCDPNIVSDLDIIAQRRWKTGEFDQWRYFFSYFDNVRVKELVRFPYTWGLISKMKARRKVAKPEAKREKLSKKAIEARKSKSLSDFW